MGLIRFLVHPPGRLDEETARQGYFAGPDLVPWRSRNRLVDGVLLVELYDDDSGNFHISWHVERRGSLVLSTGTLMQRELSYLLPLELARGTVNRLRQQLAEWQGLGLAVSGKIRERVHEAIVLLAEAASRQQHPDEASQYADRAIVVALRAADWLVAAYTRQSFAVRHRRLPRLPTALGVHLGEIPADHDVLAAVAPALNSAVVAFNWHECEASEGTYCWENYDRQLAWAARQGMQVFGGPLLRLASDGLPDWLCLWEGDFDNLLAIATDYIETVVTRYQGQVHHWLCAAWMNRGNVMSLSEEERLHLAVRAIEVTDRIDPQSSRILGLHQPWAEDLPPHDLGFSPLQVADALVRSGLRLNGLALQIEVGYAPGGTIERHLLQWNRLIDVWSCFGLPLYISLCCPSRDTVDPRNQQHVRILPDGWSPKRQARWAQRLVGLLLARPTVHGVFWSQLTDTLPGLPHAGLFDEANRPQPVLSVLSELRQQHLN